MNLSVAYGTLVIHKYYYSFQMQKVCLEVLQAKKKKRAKKIVTKN